MCIGNTTTHLLVSLWSCWSMLCVVYVGDLGVPTRPTVFTLIVLLRCGTVLAVWESLRRSYWWCSYICGSYGGATQGLTNGVSAYPYGKVWRYFVGLYPFLHNTKFPSGYPEYYMRKGKSYVVDGWQVLWALDVSAVVPSEVTAFFFAVDEFCY